MSSVFHVLSAFKEFYFHLLLSTRPLVCCTTLNNQKTKEFVDWQTS